MKVDCCNGPSVIERVDIASRVERIRHRHNKKKLYVFNYWLIKLSIRSIIKIKLVFCSTTALVD